MKYTCNHENGLRFTACVDEQVIEMKNKETILVKEINCNQHEGYKSKRIMFELFIPRHASAYALLGLEYIESKLNKSKIAIDVTTDFGPIYDQSINEMGDTVHIGIPKEYADSILDIFNDSNENIFAGEYIVDFGAHAEVGSSQKIFQILFKIMLEILKVNNCDEDSINRIIKKELCKDKFLAKRFYND